jgi:hypothetical protein
MNNRYFLSVTFFTVLILTACRSDDMPVIAMVGTAEKELSSDLTAVSISFNGTADQKKRFQYEVQYGELSKYNPKLLHENIYQEGEATDDKNRRFVYTLNYLIILDNKIAIDHLGAIMEGKELNGNISTMGNYVDMSMMKDYQNTLFNEALSDAKDRISRFINDESKSYQIIEISEMEDQNFNPFPGDGIIYNNKITKKVRVKAKVQ